MIHWALNEVARIRRGASPRPIDDAKWFAPIGRGWVRISDVTGGGKSLRHCSQYLSKAGEKKSVAVDPGDLIMTICATIGVPKIVGIPACIHDGFVVIDRYSDFLDTSFLYYYLQSVTRSLASGGQPGTQKNLNTEIVGAIRIPAFHLREQRKIADLLTLWDEALEKTDALIKLKDTRDKAFKQKLLSGKTRLNGFNNSWMNVRLRETAEDVSDQNKGRMGTESLYGVTKARGVVPMREHVKGESFARCKRVEHNWFAYNPMRINIGSIARWQGAEPIMVSGDYVVFRCMEDRLLPAYLDHLRRTWRWKSFVTRGGNGSVRIRIYFADLGEFSFLCPPVEEQAAIAAFLDTCDEELRLLRSQRAALEQQKLGLMRKLLTGKIRVKPENILITS